MTTLYVAPHLDDVALSCAGGVLARARAGERIVVCSIFTRTRNRPLEQRRAAEDKAALDAIGAERIDLGFADAPDREGIAASFTALMLDAKVKPRVVREVRAALARVIKDVAPRDVWFPLGIGGHIDHRTVFAARAAVGTRARARFYEDRPYAFVPAFRDLRRKELAGGPPRHRSPDAILAQLFEGACAAFVEPDERPSVAAELSSRLAKRHAGEGLALRTRIIRHPRATLPAAAAMIDAYGSQTRRLFGRERIVDIWKRHATARGAWFEREVVISRRP